MNITGSTMLALENASLKEQLAAMTHERDAITKEYDLCRKLLMDRVGDMQDSRKQIAAMTQETEEQARLLGISGSKEARLIAELAASQAREAQLREFVEGLVEGLEIPFNLHDRIRAMLTLQDNTALRQWGAKLLREMATHMRGTEGEFLERKADELDASKCAT